MKFCPKCNSKLGIVKRKEGDESVLGLSCKNCGFFEKSSGFTVKESNVESSVAIKVVDSKARDLRSMPTTPAICPKCGSDTAYFWDRQTSSLEKSSTLFLRCTKCDYTWRSS